MKNKAIYYRIDFVTYKDWATCQGEISTYVKLSDSFGSGGTSSISNTNGTVEEFNKEFSRIKAELIEQGIFTVAETKYSEGKEGIFDIYCDIYVEPKKGR